MVTWSWDRKERALVVPRPELYFRKLESDDPMMDDVHRLRYDVYCKELLFLDPTHFPNARESDAFDPHSIHFAGSNGSGKVVATLRLVRDSALGFPVEQHLDEPLPELPRGQTVEISRLIVARSHRQRAGSARWVRPVEECNPYPYVLFGLFRKMYEESLRQGVEFWLAAMEPGLWRWLRRFGFTFKQIGKPMGYFGEVIPYLAKISDLREVVCSDRPDVLRFFEPDAK